MIHRQLLRQVSFSGRGVHTGKRSVVCLSPGKSGGGWQVEFNDGRYRLQAKHLDSSTASTTLRFGHHTLRTPEHLFAAAHVLGLTDVVLALSGEEVPILDGSAEPFYLELLRNSASTAATLPTFCVSNKLTVSAAGGSASWTPSSQLSVEVMLDYGPAHRQHLVVSSEQLRSVLNAKTFVLQRNMQHLLAEGLGQGANKHNTLVWEEDGRVSGGAQTPAQHKVLDILGDLFVLGCCSGRIVVSKPSHALIHCLVGEAYRTHPTSDV